MSRSRTKRQGRAGAVLFIALIALITGIYGLYRGLTFHLVDQGPGTLSEPFIQPENNKTPDYGGHLTILANGKTVSEQDGGTDNVYHLLQQAGGTNARVPVQHVMVDRADGSPYSFEYQGSTYHVEGSRDTELAMGWGGLGVAVILTFVGVEGLRRARRY